MYAQKIIVANWKLERSVAQAIDWLTVYRADLSALAHNVQLIVCPDIITTALAAQLLQGTGVLCGAQSCSAYLSGRQTGAVSATSLREAGCTYAIVGHSEERNRSSLSNYDYVESCFMCLARGITPIFCIGEPAEMSHDLGQIEQYFVNVIDDLAGGDKYCGMKDMAHELYIAYEPMWAIGSGMLPTAKELQERIHILRSIVSKSPLSPTIRLLYGGSVTSENVLLIRDIYDLDGLLLGSSSLDMQSLKKIVYSFTK